jgi:uncharacterized peroxidase-related enzyme
MPHLRNLPPHATVFDVFMAFAEIYEPFADFSERIFRGPGPLSLQERELIFSYCSDLNACHYCFGGHAETAKLFGAPKDVFDRLRADIEAAPVPAKLKPLLRYVKKLTETPSRMTRADADAVYAAGWDDAAFHQAIALCCLANFMNRLVDGSGVEADPAKFALRAKNAAENGYQKPFLARLAARQGAAG